MESENFQGSGPLLDPRGLAVFIAPLSYGSYGSLSRRLRPGTGLLLFVVRFVRPIASVVTFFCSHSHLTDPMTFIETSMPMEDLCIAPASRECAMLVAYSSGPFL